MGECVAVLGAGGFIGNHLVSYLKAKGYWVRGVDIKSPEYSTTDVYGNVISGFSLWWVTLFYVVAMIFLGLHLYHGAWASLRTLGAAKSSPNPLRRKAALVVAIVVWAGFTAIPVAVFAGLLGPDRSAPVAPAAPASASVAN